MWKLLGSLCISLSSFSRGMWILSCCRIWRSIGSSRRRWRNRRKRKEKEKLKLTFLLVSRLLWCPYKIISLNRTVFCFRLIALRVVMWEKEKWNLQFRILMYSIWLMKAGFTIFRKIITFLWKFSLIMKEIKEILALIYQKLNSH